MRRCTSPRSERRPGPPAPQRPDAAGEAARDGARQGRGLWPRRCARPARGPPAAGVCACSSGPGRAFPSRRWPGAAWNDLAKLFVTPFAKSFIGNHVGGAATWRRSSRKRRRRPTQLSRRRRRGNGVAGRRRRREAGAEDVCSLHAATGMCKAHMPSWFHNAVTKRCEEFIYGGCGGTANRFASRAACEAACPPPTGKDEFAAQKALMRLSSGARPLVLAEGEQQPASPTRRGVGEARPNMMRAGGVKGRSSGDRPSSGEPALAPDARPRAVRAGAARARVARLRGRARPTRWRHASTVAELLLAARRRRGVRGRQEALGGRGRTAGGSPGRSRPRPVASGASGAAGSERRARGATGSLRGHGAAAPPSGASATSRSPASRQLKPWTRNIVPEQLREYPYCSAGRVAAEYRALVTDFPGCPATPAPGPQQTVPR